ncbi:MAG: Hsp20/alpha crystallin family protein [Phycisphaerae bacterium]|nr:Hsp20/alpha crystallin family protein [Phycisphaerae bacterium]
MANITLKKDSQSPEKQTQDPMQIERTYQQNVFAPKTDIYEQKDTLVLIADMPGIDENNVNIDIERRILTISGNPQPQQFKDYRMVYNEYEYGQFERSFTLSDNVDIENIKATVKDGVLKIILPKAKNALPKKISVKAG